MLNAYRVVFNTCRVVVQMPLPWGKIWVTNPLQIPTYSLTWGRWGLTMIGALNLNSWLDIYIQGQFRQKVLVFSHCRGSPYYKLTALIILFKYYYIRNIISKLMHTYLQCE